MKVVLTAITAKYIHSYLAVYCLKAYAEKSFQNTAQNTIDIEIAVYTINQQQEDILMDF